MAPLRELAKKIPYEAYPILATVAFSLSFMCYTGVHTLYSALDVSVFPQKQAYRPWMTVDPNDVPSMRFKPREERRKSESLFYASWGGIPRQIREHYVRNPKEAEPSTA